MAGVDAPPGRSAPPKPDDDMQDTVEALREQLRDMGAIPMTADGREELGELMDTITNAMAEEYGEDVHGVYKEDDEGDYEDEGEYDDEEEGDEEDGYSDEYDEDGVFVGSSRPRPGDLWRAAHETDEPQSKSLVLTKGQWDELVARLNEKAKKKKQLIAAMQIHREKEELKGARFTPTISRRSRELAANNRSLPERVQALMRRKKARLDKVREEKAQRELAEATFKPNLSKSTKSRLRAKGGKSRSVQHLMQYDKDKRIRAYHRRQIMMEMEDKELTFSPQINRRSEKLVRRREERIAAVRQKALEAERNQQKLELTPKEMAVVAGGLTEAAINRLKTKKAQAALSMCEALVDEGKLRRVPMNRLGLSMLPGHEEETFHPAINPRSRAVRKGSPSKVYGRLYRSATVAAQRRREARAKLTRQFINTDVDVHGGIDMGESFRRDLVGHTTRGVRPTDTSPGRGPDPKSSPGYVNMVPYSTTFDFVVHRVKDIEASYSATQAEKDAAAFAQAQSN